MGCDYYIYTVLGIYLNNGHIQDYEVDCSRNWFSSEFFDSLDEDYNYSYTQELYYQQMYINHRDVEENTVIFENGKFLSNEYHNKYNEYLDDFLKFFCYDKTKKREDITKIVLKVYLMLRN